MEQSSIEPILTYTGVKMFPLAPKEEDFVIEDIAHALSLMTRANGHFSHFYSVGQHCLACSLEAEVRCLGDRISLALLLHDASEAYLSDITRPVKISLPRYIEIEKELQKVMFCRFGLDHLCQEEIKAIREIDDAMLYYEFEHLHIGGGLGQEYHLFSRPSLAFCDMKTVEKAYLERYAALIKRLGDRL